MNLDETELVVLSACKTSLGDIKGNEGVYGLQRAFKLAGAKYLIMSLWQVPAEATVIFMETFYRHLVEEGRSIPEAFRATQQELRQSPFITPYQWTGFVLRVLAGSLKSPVNHLIGRFFLIYSTCVYVQNV